MKSNEELWREVRRVQAKVEKEIAEEERTRNDWHTGIPTENGFYAVYYYADNEYDYGFADWDGKYWEEHFSFDDVGCRIIAWQKIEPYKEEEDAESSFYS